jgi:RNA polymerase sigma factor (sigma-70 family)
MTVLRALAQVPARQRAVLVCRYYDGLDVAGTARALGCTEGTVKSQAARGLAALRAALVELDWPGRVVAEPRPNGKGNGR